MTGLRIIGTMSGTSGDGIDAVLCNIDQHQVDIIRGASTTLEPFANELRAFCNGSPISAAAIAGLNHAFSMRHVELIQELLGDESCDVICVHGQTVFHQPPLSWQMIQLPLIAQRCGITVCGDLRATDLAHGGQGAPITPLADLRLYPGTQRRAIVNLGGFINVTILNDQNVVGAQDVCVCNQLLDRLARQYFAQNYDENGAHAAAGHPAATAVNGLINALQQQARSGRSLGSGDEQLAWSEANTLSGNDACASAVQAIAHMLTEFCAEQRVELMILAGGGVLNNSLRSAISLQAAQHSIEVSISDAHGVPAQWREAAAMAVLGYACYERQPITLNSVTNTNHAQAISGVWAFANTHGPIHARGPA